LRPSRAALAKMPKAGDAGYNGKTVSTHGYKAHVNADEDGFIKAVEYTLGNEHVSKSLEKLLTRTEHQLYADKAHASAEHDKLLAKRNRPLSDRQKHQNCQWSSARCTVGGCSASPRRVT